VDGNRRPDRHLELMTRKYLMKFYKEIGQMALDEGDLAQIDLRCERIAERIVQCVLDKHVDTCPHGKALLKTKFIMVGIAVGSGLASGGTVIAFARYVFGGG